MNEVLEDGISVAGGDKNGARWWVGSTVPASNDPPFWMECVNQEALGWRRFKDGQWETCRQGDVIAYFEDNKTFVDGPDFCFVDVTNKTSGMEYFGLLLTDIAKRVKLLDKENFPKWEFSHVEVRVLKDRYFEGDDSVFFARLHLKETVVEPVICEPALRKLRDAIKQLWRELWEYD